MTSVVSSFSVLICGCCVALFLGGVGVAATATRLVLRKEGRGDLFVSDGGCADWTSTTLPGVGSLCGGGKGMLLLLTFVASCMGLEDWGRKEDEGTAASEVEAAVVVAVAVVVVFLFL